MNRTRVKILLTMSILSFCLASCVSTSSFLQAKTLTEAPAAIISPTPETHNKFNHTINVDIPIIIGGNQKIAIHAELSRPESKLPPKALVILVPGTGNVSRRGEISGDGIESYASPIETYALWAQALRDAGYLVLSYDKRTCRHNNNTLCSTRPTTDIDELGIAALSHDLDQIYKIAESKLGTNIILMTTTQGAQVVAHAKVAQQASAIILLSPLVGDLGSLWVDGLNKAHQLKGSKRLKDEAESTKIWFESFKNGKIASKQIYGASHIFWQSWINASATTLKALAATHKPVLLLTSTNDVFSVYNTANKFVNLNNTKNIQVRAINNADRNFIQNGHLSQNAVTQVLNFMHKLPAP